MTGDLFGKWVEALRSGKYLQCRFQLRGEIRRTHRTAKDHPDIGKCGHCCLGVLAEVVKPTLLLPFQEAVELAMSTNTSALSNVTLGKGTLLSIVGMSAGLEGECIELNDCDGYSFTEIADALEEKQRKGELV